MKTVDSLNSCYSSISVVYIQSFDGTVFLTHQHISIIISALWKRTHILSPQWIEINILCNSCLTVTVLETLHLIIFFLFVDHPIFLKHGLQFSSWSTLTKIAVFDLIHQQSFSYRSWWITKISVCSLILLQLQLGKQLLYFVSVQFTINIQVVLDSIKR